MNIEDEFNLLIPGADMFSFRIIFKGGNDK